MKKIRILGIFVILLFVLSMAKDFIPGFIDGWNNTKGTEMPGTKNIYIEVHSKKDIASDSIFNKALNCDVPYQTEKISVPIRTNTINNMLTIPLGILSLLVIYGYYCLAKMLFSVCRGNILTSRNTHRLRVFIYLLIGVAALLEVSNYLDYLQAADQLVSTRYELANFTLNYAWTEYFVIMLLVEIFAQAVKIKEEQDLTI